MKRLFILSFAMFTLLFVYTDVQATTLTRAPANLGLVGYWSFNEATSTIAGDFSGNGNNGTLTSMAFPPTSTSGWTNQGKRGGALNFDGSNDYVDVERCVNARIGA